jgi:hypothetical protein
MPYIKEVDRKEILKSGTPATPGELNFVLTAIAELYRRDFGDSYRTFNDIIGALEAAKLEFYRRVVVPYEDFKCDENGDVYENLHV